MRPSAGNDALFKRALLKEAPVDVLKMTSDRGANYFATPSFEYQTLEKASCFTQLCNSTEEIMAIHCWGSLKPGLVISSSSSREADNILRSLRAGLPWEQPLTDAGDLFLTRKSPVGSSKAGMALEGGKSGFSSHFYPYALFLIGSVDRRPGNAASAHFTQ